MIDDPLKPEEAVHVLRQRIGISRAEAAVCEQAHAFDATIVLIKDMASGTQLIQELVQEGRHAVTCYQPQLIKQDHALSALPKATPVASAGFASPRACTRRPR